MARSLALNLVDSTCSYDPLSPSYDPNAASPCNPFPTSSPFLPVEFKRSQPSNLSSLIASIRSMSLAAHEQCTPFLPRIPPPHSAPSLRRTKPCRFYLDIKGCKSGRWCNFKHPVGARPISETSEMAEAPVEGWYNVPDVRDLDPNWGKEMSGDLHPKFRTQPCRNYYLGLCRFGDKCQFIHPPDVISTLSTLPAIPTSIPIEYVKLAALSPYANVLPPLGSVDAVFETPSNPAVVPPKHDIPCSNFEMDGECSHGSQCQFVHKPKPTAVRIKVEVKHNNNSKTTEQDEELNADRKQRVRLPKAQKKTGAIKQVSGIHKPTWRVVGGGVPLAATSNPGGRSNSSNKRQSSALSLSTGSTTGSQSPMTLASSPSPSTISLPSPGYLSIDSSLADLSQYDFATPAHFPNQEDFLRAPSPDVPLDIAMGSPELYDLPMHRGPRKRVILTGNDLIRQMREGNRASSMGSSPSFSHRERCRSKPQLTIHVPSLRKSRSSVDIVRGDPGQTPFPHLTTYSVGPDGMDTVAEMSDHVTDAVDCPDDFRDENDDDDDDDGEERSRSNEKYTLHVAEEIQRPHSTPPTPWSSSYVQVPILPRLPAESP